MYYIGVDLGGTNIATGLMEESGKLIHKCSAKTLGHRPPEEITADIAKTVFQVLEETGKDLKDVEGIGVGIPGCMDEKKVILTNNMNFSNFEFVKELQKYVDKPIKMANDANCAALGEMVAGAAKGYRDVVMITIGTGIGGGFVTGGRVYNGFNGAAMEVGHITIDYQGKPCNCGRKGCWERYASANALVELTKKVMAAHPDSKMHQFAENGEVSGKTAFLAARAGDLAGNAVVDEFSDLLAVGISDLINLFQPEILLVGGGISKEGDYLLDKLRCRYLKMTYAAEFIPNTIIKKAELGNDAGIIGAGFLLA